MSGSSLLTVLSASLCLALAAALLIDPLNHGDFQIAPPKVQSGNTFTYVSLENDDARCLDGSYYGIFICQGPNVTKNGQWTIAIQGGGWCYNETECLQRASTALGSSKTWPAEAASMACDPAADQSIIQFYYCDGASFTGYREDPVNVNGSNIYFRGIMNLDRSLDLLFAKYNLADATLLVLTGGSAGGLSTFLHLDHVQSRMPTTTRVVGEPVCGFFIDHGNDGFAPEWYTYPNFMKYVYNMQNSSGSLSTACQKSYRPEDAWMCIMAPHAVPFIQTPWFTLQSRFDKWQLGNELFLTCMNAQPYSPPYKNSSCTPDQDIAIQNWGVYFMAQLNYTAQPTRNGGFIDACIIHGSTNSLIDGKYNYQAFEAWLAGGQSWYIMQCNGSDTAGPCDTSTVCAPFP
jgi:hypothetical protein